MNDVGTDARKQEKFREGLSSEIKLALAPLDFADFATLVSKAFQVETALNKREESPKRTRDVGPSSGQPTQKLRVWIPHNVYHRPVPTPRPSYVAPRLPPPPRQLPIPMEQPNIMAPPLIQTNSPMLWPLPMLMVYAASVSFISGCSPSRNFSCLCAPVHTSS